MAFVADWIGRAHRRRWLRDQLAPACTATRSAAILDHFIFDPLEGLQKRANGERPNCRQAGAMSRSMGGLRRLRVFVGFVMADCAACGSTQYAMMTREMPSGTANHGTLEAALCVGGNRRNGDSKCQCRAA